MAPKDAYPGLRVARLIYKTRGIFQVAGPLTEEAMHTLALPPLERLCRRLVHSAGCGLCSLTESPEKEGAGGVGVWQTTSAPKPPLCL